MTGPQSPSNPKQSTKTLLFQTILNHASWSTLHVAARWLQVYAQPIKFDGQGVLSSAKGFAALFLFLLPLASSWSDKCYAKECGKKIADSEGLKPSPSLLSLNSSVGTSIVSAPCSNDSHRPDDIAGSAQLIACVSEGEESAMNEKEISGLSQQQKSPIAMPISSSSTVPSLAPASITSSDQTNLPGEEIRERREAAILHQRKVMYTLLFAFVSTCRASLNIASAKFTYPYNISE